MLNICLLTTTDTRTLANDDSGNYLAEKITEIGHTLANRHLVSNNTYLIRAVISQWAIMENCDVIITTGGTGLSSKDITIEAIQPLFDKSIEGFGEYFREISKSEIKTSTMLSRAMAGIINGRAVFCLPGSTGASKCAWDGILKYQLNLDTKPCNIYQTIKNYKK